MILMAALVAVMSVNAQGIMPEKGDMGVEIGLRPFSESAVFNLIDNGIRLRYFLTDNDALRLRLGFNWGQTKETTSSSNLNKSGYSNCDLSLGYERHWGVSERISLYAGVQAGCSRLLAFHYDASGNKYETTDNNGHDSIAGKGVTLDALNAWYHKLRDALESTNNVCLANAVWTQKGYPINRNFISTNKTYYDAEIGHLDFTQTTQAKDSICQWAYYHTFGNIHELNLPINESTRIVAANATWFGAEWTKPFNADNTRKDTFVLSSGKKQTVDMMQNRTYYSYAEASSYRLLSMDFVYQNFSLLIALPLEGYSANDILPAFIKKKPSSFSHSPFFLDFRIVFVTTGDRDKQGLPSCRSYSRQHH